MALRAVTPLLSTLAIAVYLSVLGPVGFIYAMLMLRIFFWPFLLSTGTIVYLLVERFDKNKPRRKWKFWEPSRDHWKKR